jgi:arsenate reductase (thioredoxin)
MNLILSLLLLSMSSPNSLPERAALSPAVAQYLDARAKESDQISELRRQDLERLAQYIRTQRSAGQTPRLLFVCTHNSRRSHLAQVWARVTGGYLGIEVETHSAGTEATAFHKNAVAALERAGLTSAKAFGDLPGGPRYSLTYGAGLSVRDMYSKTIAQADVKAPFAAVMVCSDADKKCPFVPGANARVAIAYDDPKAADGTPDEAKAYDERCAQIAREMLYVMQRVVN